MPREVTAHFIRTRKRAKGSCAPGSFRTVKRGRNRIVVCCAKGHWRKKRCTTSMRAQSVLRRRKGR